MNHSFLTDSAMQKPYFGFGPSTERVVKDIKIAAAAPCTALILGETGSGKGVLARWIHNQSPRKKMPFVDINCSGLKGELLKTELFGHARGAFTGAVNDRPGLIEEANGGTLFLDEIGEMDMEVQCQMLKSIEEKTFRRVGENNLRSSNFRLICATNSNLPNAVKNGAFRADLYYRINTLLIKLPPLRAHREDIAGLLNYMLANMGYRHFPVSEVLVNKLTRYRWPGNIRELRNSVERALMFAQGEPLTTEHFSGLENVPSNPAARKEPVWNLDKVENEQIRRALKHFNGNKNQTCQALGISLSSLYRKLDNIWKGNASGAVT